MACEKSYFISQISHTIRHANVDLAPISMRVALK